MRNVTGMTEVIGVTLLAHIAQSLKQLISLSERLSDLSSGDASPSKTKEIIYRFYDKSKLLKGRFGAVCSLVGWSFGPYVRMYI